MFVLNFLTYCAASFIVAPGFARFTLNAVSGIKPENSDLILNWKLLLRSLTITALIAVRVFLWSLLLIVPGIIAMSRYSLAYYVMNENPNMKAADCLKESSRKIKGNELKLLKTVLSFLGLTLAFQIVAAVLIIKLSTVLQTISVFHQLQLRTGIMIIQIIIVMIIWMFLLRACYLHTASIYCEMIVNNDKLNRCIQENEIEKNAIKNYDEILRTNTKRGNRIVGIIGLIKIVACIFLLYTTKVALENNVFALIETGTIVIVVITFYCIASKKIVAWILLLLGMYCLIGTFVSMMNGEFIIWIHSGDSSSAFYGWIFIIFPPLLVPLLIYLFIIPIKQIAYFLFAGILMVSSLELFIETSAYVKKQQYLFWLSRAAVTWYRLSIAVAVIVVSVTIYTMYYHS